MVNKAIRLESLNLEELGGVVNIYPWFGLARMELCRRMSKLGEGVWDEERFARESLWIGNRRLIYELSRKKDGADLSDKEVEKILASFLEEKKEGEGRRILVVGGDYFSAEQYNNVRRDDDNFARTIKTDGKDVDVNAVIGESFTDFCTETLARVYLDQGYPDMAKNIYSQLSLRYPEKSVYFAALIDKIDNN